MQVERLDGLMDDMRGVVTYRVTIGRAVRCIPFKKSYLEDVGLAEAMRREGFDYKPKTERVPLYQRGRRIGTLPGSFDPIFIKSINPLYQVRGGDFVRTDDGWKACNTMGPGDLESVPGFVWDRR